MRVLHAALMLHYEPGIYQQMAWESSAAGGELWDSRIFTDREIDDPAGILVRWEAGTDANQLARWAEVRRAFYRWLEAESGRYDVVLVRHSSYDPFRRRGLKRIQAFKGSVHHTLEGPELRMLAGRSPRGLAMWLLENWWARGSLRECNVIVGVTPEIVEYEAQRARSSGIPTLVYPNGVDIEASPPATDRREDVPSILFSSGTFQAWQGLDILLSSIASERRDFELNIVGHLDPALAESIRDPRVIFHGFLRGEEYTRLLERSWVGVSSLALDRKGMKEACTLKVRQYLSAGVPVYAGHRDVFGDNSLFFREGEASVSQIVDYAMEVRHIDRPLVAAQARRFIDKAALVESLRLQLAALLPPPPGETLWP